MDQDLTKTVKSHLHPFTNISESSPPTYVIDRAKGVFIYDQTGKEYIDGLSGLWCVNAGYNNPNITEAMCQASKETSFAHTMFGASNKYADRLAQKLIELSPGNMRKVFFGHSGSDANDTNLKLARLYFLAAGQPERKKFISRDDSYHGTTFATASLSGLPGHHRNFNLPEPQYLHVSAPDTFSALNQQGFKSEEPYADWLANELENTIAEADPCTVAAFVVEPIIAVAGILLPPRTYFTKVKQVLDKYGILLIVDDVVCSFGRIGHWFGWETTEVQPDLVALAKGLTSGYIPMSASILGERVWSMLERHQDEIGVLGHGFTMSGHPVAAAAALANINILEKNHLLQASIVKGRILMTALKEKLHDHPNVVDVRGAGLLIGIELTPSIQNVIISKTCLELGLIVRAAPRRNVIALAPPLTISELEMERMVDILVDSLRRVFVN